jgi:hypothetical protein
LERQGKLTIIIPHSIQHEVRTPLYKTLGPKAGDVIVVYDKAVLMPRDYVELKQVAREKLGSLNGKEVALLLAGSHAACVVVYEVLRELGCDVTLLQYDAYLRRYVVVKP